jgi:AmmeMemoRadiSam system protein B
MNMVKVAEVRPSPIAGKWYTGEPAQLRREVDGYLAQAEIPELDGEVVAVVAPHAGHVYSGATAGYAFKPVLGMKFDLVIIASPYHDYHPGVVLTSAHEAYSTPLGPILINRSAVIRFSQILEESSISVTSLAFDQEHSLEIELPFLQRCLQAGFQILPVMVRTNSEKYVKAIGHALALVAKQSNTLLVGSTDLSHFHPEPDAQTLDKTTLKQIESLSPEGLLEAENNGTGSACGAGAVAAVMTAAIELGADSAAVLHHSTSAEETGDYESVVGYGAAVLYKRA